LTTETGRARNTTSECILARQLRCKPQHDFDADGGLKRSRALIGLLAIMLGQTLSFLRVSQS
jgi:hypothetical protein